MMDLDSAIRHCLEVADGQTAQGRCPECAEEHRQLAEWLTDYKRLKEQQPCDDCISRQAVIDTCLNMYFNGYKEKDLIHDIKNLPPVTSQKTGYWILSDDGLYRPICDKCGAHPWKGYIPTVEEATEVFKYCPNCGCRMVEPQESEGV